jgi:probable HAF family extracellular repeat protein
MRFLLLVIMVFGSIAPSSETLYDCTKLSPCNAGDETQAFEINNEGLIVGNSSGGLGTSGVLWKGKKVIPVETLGGFYNNAQALNDCGQIVGSSDVPRQTFHAYMKDRSGLFDLQTLGGNWSSANKINNKGDVVGFSQVKSGDTHAFFWHQGIMDDITSDSPFAIATAVNNQEEIVGFFEDPITITNQAFLWRKGILATLGNLGGLHAYATGINDQCQIVGTSWTPNGYRHPFLWQQYAMTDLGVLPGDLFGEATDINKLGQIVGYSGSLGGEDHPWLWQNGKMIDLNSCTLLFLGFHLDRITSINDLGEMVGWGHDECGYISAVLVSPLKRPK